MNEPEIQAFSEVILPPGSTSVDLQIAIDTVASGDVISLSGNMVFMSSVHIAQSKIVTIQSNAGNNWILSTPGSNIRHFEVNDGSLILQNITLDGGNIGGGVEVANGNVTIQQETVIQNCNRFGKGGAIFLSSNCTMKMTSGSIQNNTATDTGGGIYVSSLGMVTMTGGELIGNSSNNQGGGLDLADDSNTNLSNLVITGNIAPVGAGMFAAGNITMSEMAFAGNTSTARGGAIFISEGTTATLKESVISGNIANAEGGGIFIADNTTVELFDVTISGNTSPTGGGIFAGGQVTMSELTISGNTSTARGGAIFMPVGSTAMLTASLISGNSANVNGGGIFISENSQASLVEVNVSGNTSFNGGGVFIGGSVAISDTIIKGNIANANGGGIGMSEVGTLNLSNSLLDENWAVGDGGAIYTSGHTELIGENIIQNNHAHSGGGIDTTNSAYDNLVTSNETLFICNMALTAHQPPMNARALYPNLGFASTTITDHPLNHYDINYEMGEPIIAKFHVTYRANGGLGHYVGLDTEPGDSYTIQQPEDVEIIRPNYLFIGWNTHPDGSGTAYFPGDTIVLDCSLVLYAQWKSSPSPTPRPKEKTCAPATKCRRNIEGQKIWVDYDNVNGTRPASVTIILLRDGELYKQAHVDATGDGYFSFCCLPVQSSDGWRYNYQLDELVPDGYTKTIEGYKIINTLNP